MAGVENLKTSYPLDSNTVLIKLLISSLSSNSIALMVYARRDEIEILQLVGTTDSMIRFPMMVEGAVMGAGGVVLALLSMKLAVFYGQSWILQQLQDVLAGHIVFLSAPLQLSFAMAGVVLGALGSYLSVNRFLKI